MHRVMLWIPHRIVDQLGTDAYNVLGSLADDCRRAAARALQVDRMMVDGIWVAYGGGSNAILIDVGVIDVLRVQPFLIEKGLGAMLKDEKTRPAALRGCAIRIRVFGFQSGNDTYNIG